ncbi:MAG: DUF2628 domain-containing protein [Methylococcaceae bacterium]|nr:MAG: DUF2628 domain-containing protein [Methylococcaceae bacterium]
MNRCRTERTVKKDMIHHYETAIGDLETQNYLRRFARFDAKRGWYVPSWNWPACLFMGVWALYRKMYKNFWYFAWIFGFFAFAEEASGLEDLFLLTWVITAIFYGLAGDYFYYRHIRHVLREAEPLSAVERIPFLEKKGGIIPWVPWVFGFLGIIGAAIAISIPLYDYFEKSHHRSALYQPKSGGLP